jgi:hypothetical protein
MTKSTPIAKLKSSEKETKTTDDQLVNEILQEIEDTEPLNTQEPLKNIDDKQESQELDSIQENFQQQNPIVEEKNELSACYDKLDLIGQDMAQALYEEQVQKTELLKQIKEQKEIISNSNSKDTPKEPKTFMEMVIDYVKHPLIVGIICLLFSTSYSTDILSNFLPNKEFIMNNSGIFIGFIKMLLSSVLFFGINQVV